MNETPEIIGLLFRTIAGTFIFLIGYGIGRSHSYQDSTKEGGG